MELLEPRQLLSVQTYSGQLNGKIIYTSGGHGWQWNSTLGRWATDRGENNEMVEDFGNQEQMSFYADYALRAGATVVPMRPVGHQLNEVVLDNDSAGVTYSGAWTNSTGSRYYDEDYGAVSDAVHYRFASTDSTETATATYTPNIPQAGLYPVYTWVASGTNRTTQLYRINHTGGQTELRIDHSKVGNGWVYLGTYHFNAGSSPAAGSVQISNQGPLSKVVIADAIRFGNGMGDVKDGNDGVGASTGVISGYSREEENSLMWLWRSVGQGVSPSTVVGTSNVSAPARMAEWMNVNTNPFGTAVYIGFHSNAGGGRGARGLMTNSASLRTPHQADLALYTGSQINNDMQSLNGVFAHDWYTGSTDTYAGINFGEIDNGDFTNSSNVVEMDATIIEVAFHDDVQDAELMRDPDVRMQLAKSTLDATQQYFDNYGGLTTPVNVPSAPLSPRATALANGNITLNWSAGPGGARGGTPTGYRIYTSRDGYGFGDPVNVGSGVTSYTFNAAQLDSNAYYFAVTATNAGGESPMSYVVGARKNGTGGGGGTNRILVINGFDRADHTNNYREAYLGGVIDRVLPHLSNSFDYVVQAGEAIEAYTAGGVSLGFDSAQNEHVISGAVNLGNYQTVIWLSGEESTVDETFNATEQSKVTTFINGGGRLFVSGAEIGWDLEAQGGGASFYNNTLRTDYVSDDAGTYNVAAVAGSIFAGLPTLSFNSKNSIYDAEYPDRIQPTAGSGATGALNYSGGTGGNAAIQWDSGIAGGARLVSMGFPFETITTATNRNNVMARVLNFFETAVSATPATPDLVAGSDTGSSSTDNQTNRNNGSAGSTLQFTVGGTTSGATVRIYIDDIIIGVATATGTTTTVTTNGTTLLADGVHSVRATQQAPDQTESDASAALSITIDTTGPTVTGYTVNDGNAQRSRVTSLTVTFDQAVFFDPGAFTVVRRGDNLSVSATASNPSSDGKTWVLTFSGAGTEFGSLADGIYDLTVVAANVSDVFGNDLSSSGGLTFHRLFGDSDGDKDVDSLDSLRFRSSLGVVANYKSYFDFDNDGDIDSLDSLRFRLRQGTVYSY